MANRSITVTLRANVQDFKSQFDAATRAAEQTAKQTEDSAKRADTAMGRMVQSAQENRQAWTTAGTTLTAFGAAALGGLGLAVKGAMDWETAWAGVLKTVDGTPAQLNAIEEGLRGMARELPASHAEIAAVAEAAGQLGIETPNVLGFTRTMIDMGEATNMSAETAAMSLARFMNITQTSQADVGRLGATVVGLGNNFASTESEIVEMSQRLAGAGAQAGMSEGEIMGMATALSSVGIEAQAGGSALSRTMTTIGMEVDTGGDKLETFAMVAGMSAEQFVTAWREDPAQALNAFVTGLSETERMGMSTNQVLSELGITAIRESDALRRLAGSGGVLTNAMAMGNAEWEKGTALIEEAAQRYETAESRIAMAKNALVDMGISVGQVVLPAFANLADGAADVFGWFADLPGPVHAVAGGLAGVAGAASLGAGAFLLVTPRVLDTVSAFRDLGAISPGTASKVGRLTLGIGKLGLAVAALAAVPPVLNAVTDAIRGIDNAELDLGMNELTSGLMEAERSGQVFDNVLGDMYKSGALNKQMFSDLGGTIQEVSNINWFQNLIGPLAATGINDAKDRLEGLSDAFVVLSQTDLSTAQGTFAAFIAEAEEGGATFEQVMEVMPTFRNELVGLAETMGLDGTDNAVLYRIAIGELSPVVDEATGAVTGFEEGMDGAAEATQSVAEAADEAIAAMSDLASEFINAERSAMDYADALDEANDLIKENGQAWEDGTEAGDENKRMLLDLADQAWATADALSADNKSGTFLEGAREDLIDVATEMIGSREEAEKYVDQLLGTPAEIETIVKLEADAAREEWDALWDDLGYHPPLLIDPEVDPDGKLPQFTGLIDSIPPETNTDVNVDTDEAAEKAWGFQGVIEGATEDQDVNVGADIEPAMGEVARLESLVMASGGTVTINGETYDAESSLTEIMRLINSSDGTVTINGEDYPAEDALNEILRQIDMSDGTVTIGGDNAPANSATDDAVGYADRGYGTMMIGGNISDSTWATDRAVGYANRSRGSISVSAVTSAANRAIDYAARRRFATIQVNYSGIRNNLMAGRADGGWLNKGLNAGGWVPGAYPGAGVDNTIWPVRSGAAGGKSLDLQPLAGTEFVVNGRSARQWGPMLEAINSGMRPEEVAPVQSAPAYQSGRGQSGPVMATIPPGLISSEIRAGLESATVIAQVSDRVAAQLHQRGRSASRAFGGAK